MFALWRWRLIKAALGKHERVPAPPVRELVDAFIKGMEDAATYLDAHPFTFTWPDPPDENLAPDPRE